MKLRSRSLKTILFFLIAMLGYANSWANGTTYYARATVQAAPTGAGTVYVNSSGNTSANGNASSNGQSANVSFTLYATPNAGYTFVGWYSGNNSVGTNATQPVTISANSTNSGSPTTVNYEARFYGTFHFSASAIASPSAGGTASVNLSNTSVNGATGASSATTTATFTATPNTGYAFVGWRATENGSNESTNSTYAKTITSTSVNSGSPTNTTLYAIFQVLPKFYFSASTAVPSGGGTATVSPTSAEVYGATPSSTSATTTATFTATPSSANYEFVGWYSDAGYNTQVSTSATYNATITSNSTNSGSPTNTTLYARFEEKPLFYFSATATASAGGTATASPATTNVRGEHWNSTSATTSVTYTATANSGYRFVGWYSDAGYNTQVSTNTSYNANVSSTSTNSGSPTNTTLYARFQPYPTAVTTTESEMTLCLGETGTFTYGITPVGAYENINVTSGNTGVATVSVSGNTVTVTGVAAGGPVNVTVAARNESNSTIVSRNVAVTVQNYVSTPVISYNAGENKIEITTTTPGATIYYTTNGNTPTTSSTQYTAPFTQTSAGTIKAIAVKDGMCPSEVGSRIMNQPAEPVITLNSDNTISITCATAGAVIHYTVDGSTPDASSATFSSAFAMPESPVTVKAVAVQNGIYSDIATEELVGNLPTPTISINASGNVVISVTGAPASGTKIRYTTDGTTPTESSSEYSAPFALGNATVIKAIVFNTGYNHSGMAELYPTKVETPTIHITTSGVSFSTASTGTATFYYTTDGTTPTTSSSSWTTASSPITSGIADGATIKVIAVISGMIASDEASKIYHPASGVSGGVVTLNDVEDHRWSYYSDATCPIRSLSPADVKITYYGNGIMMKGTSDYTEETSNSDYITTSSSDYEGSAKVNVGGENENTFVYYKTLERGAETQTAWTYSTTHTAAASRCPYTTIPNPFQVRPTYGTAPNSNRASWTGWRGFQCWRLKSVSGGAVYRTSSGGDTLSEGAVINAETEIFFAPNSEYGMEVQLEAVWAIAYIVYATDNGSFSVPDHASLGYERNFVVLSTNKDFYFGGGGGNQTANITNINRPSTITPYLPNGTSGNNQAGRVKGVYANSANNRHLTLQANTKFENVQFNFDNSNNNLYANSNDLIIGRGCTGTISTIRGVESNSYRPKHLRVESGTITNFYLGGQSVTYTSGTITAKATLGCDYDRAKDDHGKLSITSDIYGGTSFRNTAAANRSVLSFDWTVKSGTFHDPNSVGYGGGGDEGIYLSSSGLQNTDYNGKHYIKIEGGHFASIAGGMDGGYAANDGEPTCKIRMTGGHIYGAIYGAAEFAGAVGDRLFIITGGEIDGWIAGGCNGTATTGGLLNGNTSIYFGGSASVGNQSGGTHVGQDNFNNTNQSTRGDTGADGGNIFGAGCGILSRNTRSPYAVNTNWQTATVGNVNNSTIVVSDEAHVWRDVHGGGNYGWVADNGTTTILIAGNAIIGGNDGYGNVFGGSNNQQGQEVVITVKGGDVKGGVYGGSHSWGVINDNVTMNISGGLIETGAFGGGFGTADNSCDVTGTVDITMTGGTVLTGLYGGGNVNSKINGKTTVNVNGGTVGSRDANASVYGGGLGAATRAKSSVEVNVGSRTDCAVSGSAVIYGDVYGGSAKGITNCNDAGTQRTSGAVTDVTLNKGTINGSLYGGGHGIDNATANVWGPVTVKVYGGTVTGGVYGANNLSGAPQNSVTVDIYGTDAQPENGYAIANVYGGGNMAEYSKNDYPTVTVHNCNNSIGNVYGGGNAAKVQQTNVTIYGGNRIGAVYAGGNGTGVSSTFVMVTNNAVAKIYGGTIGRVFAGNNSSGIVNGSKTVTIDASTDETTDETTNASNCITCGNSPMKIGAVFHGGNNAAGSAGTVNIVCTGATTDEYIDTLFGGANNADIVNNDLSTASGVSLTIDRGYIRSGIFGGNNAGGKVTGNIEINIKRNSTGTCAYSYPTVFGGGYGAGTSTGGNITVNIGEKTATNTAPTVVATIEGGAVYGGSALGSVNDASNETTTVNIYNGTISGNIYGGGLGEARNATKGKVNGVVTVNIGASDQSDGNCTSDLTACSVYGCNNTGGSPQGDVTVHVYRTGHSTTNERSYTVNDGVNGEPTYAIDQVFGGGNAADYNPADDNKATVYIHGCDNTVRRVFGGGNAAAAKGVVTTIEGGRYDYVFGGGNGEDIAANIGSGGTNLTVSAGLIHHLFGGSNEQGTINGPMRVSVSNSGDCDEQIDEFFGGGNLANLGSDGNEITLNTTIECNTVFGDIYGGSNLADIYGTVTLTVNGGQISRVFAGSKGVASGDATYPSGKAANIYGNVKLNIYGGDIERAFGGSNINGNISGTIGVDLDWSKSNCSQKEIDYIYGASNDATYTPTAQAATGTNYSPTVKLINGTVGVNVYGGGKGSTAIVTASPKVIVGDATNASNKATVNGDVFGGGDAADVNGRTNVIVGHTSTVMGNVFGGGNAAAIKKVNGNYGNTLVILKDKARVYKNVYGGGNQGVIESDTKVVVNSN